MKSIRFLVTLNEHDKWQVLEMMYFIYFLFIVSWPNLVPAVAVIQGRLAFFIFIRFKGYLDGLFILTKETDRLEYYGGGIYSIERGKMKFFNTFKTDNSENNPLCSYWRWGTKAWVSNRIRYPNSPCRKWWMP